MGSRQGTIKAAAARLGISLEEYLTKLDAGLKWCTKCKGWKQITEFAKDKSRGDGLKASCLQCGRVEVRKDTKGKTSPFKGKKHSTTSCQKMSLSRYGNTNRLGKPCSSEQKSYIRQRTIEKAARGVKHPNWKGGITPENIALRQSPEYIDWRRGVFERDGYTCQHCGDNRGGNLEAHHIKLFSDYPEFRFVIDNGLTLCNNCHRKVHSKRR